MARSLQHPSKKQTGPPAKGFTLIELLAVITIIALLASLLLPAAGDIVKKARRAVAAKNLRSIAVAYLAYTYDGGDTKQLNAASIHDWARILAQYANLNDPSIYILKNDPLVEAIDLPFPQKIAQPGQNPGDPWEIDPLFAQYPISFAVANRLAANAPTSTTPLAWTRGLQAKGTWTALNHPQPSPNGQDGGHIVFLDGHVEWHENLNQAHGALLDSISQEPTHDIQRAIGPQAKILQNPTPDKQNRKEY